MPRKITPATSLDNLKKEAKNWLKLLRTGNAEARARLERTWPNSPGSPVLRDVQHALALEHGVASWIALKEVLAHRPAIVNDGAQLVDRFLEYACPDHHVRGRPAHRVASHAALRLLQQHPEIARANIYTATVCGEIDEVQRLLRRNPKLAKATNAAAGRDRSGGGSNYDFLEDFGSKPWTPLLFLCFARLDSTKANDNSVAIARLLLDYGADPNAYFMAGDSHYTPLTGAIGEGEEDRPPHSRRDELARLLLERGAEPYDQQVNYNIHFHGNVLWWLKLMYEFSVNAGRASDWNDPEWHMLDMGGYGCGARWHLWIALKQNDLALAEWCLQHGANPSAPPPKAKNLPQRSLYEEAIRAGRVQLAELLARYGAHRIDVALDDEEAFVTAALRLDRARARQIVADHPEVLRSPKAIFAAAKQDRADVVEFLLDLGTSIEVEDPKKQRPLHIAAASNALAVAELLIARGAEIDPIELNWENTPLDFAIYHDHPPMIELLSRYSQNVWNLAFVGVVDRLREVLAADPRRAKVTWQTTPLFWLPEDEDKALEIVSLFLQHGADPAFRSKKDGSSAADVARKRGMLRVAAVLDAAAGGASAPEDKQPEHSIAVYEQLAQDLVVAHERDDEDALERLGKHFDRILTSRQIRDSLRRRLQNMRHTADGDVAPITIAEARDVIASQSGYKNWAALLTAVGVNSNSTHSFQDYEQAARDFVAAHDQRDAAALDRLNQHYGRSFSFDDLFGEIWRRNYAFRQRSSREPKNYLKLEEAQMLVAQDAGYNSWQALTKALETGAPPIPAFAVDEETGEKQRRITPRRRLHSQEWDDLISAAREQRAAQLDAFGLMSDEMIKRVASLEHITSLSLGGSHELSDDGLLELARMPQLQQLDLSEYPGGKLTDRGLEVLRHLPNLRHFEMTWQRGITDAGVANLRFCEQLEEVNLMGTPTGDSAIEALRGKPRLRRFATGRLVTDAGLALLQEFPQFKEWHGPAVTSGANDVIKRAPRLLIDGPFTDAGLVSMAGLEGVFELVLFWHSSGISSDGLRHLAGLPNLGALGCDGELSNDVAMSHYATLPRLRRLMAQGTVATDDGFVALSQSQTLEGLWTRETPNLTGRGFRAFAQMPALGSLGVSCKQVEDSALATLPSFPALREITPIDVHDEGFRHIGGCKKLKRLTCMYCRDTTDVATEHIAKLHLKYYYAGLTQITDRSLEILGRMSSLEQIEFYECKGVTDAGLPHVAKLSRLREVHFDGLPQVTLEGTRVFPKRVRVKYSTG